MVWLRCLPILLSFQHGDPYSCCSQDNRNIIAFLEWLRGGGLNIHDHTAVGILCNRLDVVEVSESAAILRCIARYFDRFIRQEFIDQDGKQYLAILEGDLGNPSMNILHENLLSGRRGLGKVSERLPGSWQVALALVEVERLGSSGVCFGDLARRGQDVREFE